MYHITGKPAQWEKKSIFSWFCRWPTFDSPRLLWWSKIRNKHLVNPTHAEPDSCHVNAYSGLSYSIYSDQSSYS